jgi:hypothetical protein
MKTRPTSTASVRTRQIDLRVHRSLSFTLS